MQHGIIGLSAYFTSNRETMSASLRKSLEIREVRRVVQVLGRLAPNRFTKECYHKDLIISGYIKGLIGLACGWWVVLC